MQKINVHEEKQEGGKLYVIFCLFLFVIVVVFCAIRFEECDWNNGFCKRHGMKWVSFDVDSSGAVGYTCNSRCYTWQSYKNRKHDIC